ncbi:MAG: hypothetical protein GC179_28580 [Anaerolineaceae bacterium]|nr:hypothetical protein [Anaerolineaceae bacterium]
MADLTILTNEYATLVYHEDTKIVHHTFLQPIGGQPFRDILLAGVDCMTKYGATKWLSDDRENSELSPDDGKWATTIWAKLVQDAGWKSWALVVPNDILGRLNMVEFVNLYSKRGVRVQVFTKLEEALAWLEQQSD